MTEDQRMGRIIEIVREYRADPSVTFEADTAFADIGLDSLEVVQLSMKVEDELGVEFSDGEINSFNRPVDIYNALTKRDLQAAIDAKRQDMAMREVSDGMFYTSGRRDAMMNEIAALEKQIRDLG